MLTEIEFSDWLRRLHLSEEARELITSIRQSEPVRNVQSGVGNVSGRFPSRKMMRTIQFESHRVELPGIYSMEHDPACLEYYDQPGKIKLVYQDQAGTNRGVLHTPDIFALWSNSAGWEEWKREEDLHRLATKMPNRYVLGTDGKWRCPPGETYAARFGLYYRVRSSAEIDWQYQRNLVFLEDYLRSSLEPVHGPIADAVSAIVKEKPGLSLMELLNSQTGATPDFLFRMLVNADLYVDLSASPLAEPQRVKVFITREAANAYQIVSESGITSHSDKPVVEIMAGATVSWDGKPWSILNIGETKLSLKSTDGRVISMVKSQLEDLVRQGEIRGLKSTGNSEQDGNRLLASANERDLAEANRRYSAILPFLKGGERPNHRSIRRYLSQYRHAEKSLGNGYLGLLPQKSKRGNRQPKLDPRTRQLMDHFIEEHYETLKGKNQKTVYGELLKACDMKGVPEPSFKTFTVAVRSRPIHEQTLKREGRRSAYRHSPFYWELSMTTPRHGDRPFEVVHIDHTQLDVEVVCSQTQRNLGRPWVTFMVDAYSRRILALFLSFWPPSYLSCLMVLRICVKKHGRLPQSVVVDGGREFNSVYFESFLAMYECTKKSRPPAQARFGSVCERLFGTANEQLIHNLAGNTKVMRNVRQVTKSVNPKNHAVWVLADLHHMLSEWAYEVYDTLQHPALGQSPRDAFQAGLAVGGTRPERIVPYNDDFILTTLPTTTKGTAKVQPGMGVKIQNIYFWSDAFREQALEGKSVPIRFDPFDAGVAFAQVGRSWVRCISQYYSVFQGRSWKEVEVASEELRKRHQRSDQQLRINAKMIAGLIEVAEQNEALLTQRLADRESIGVVNMVEGNGNPSPDQSTRVARTDRIGVARPHPAESNETSAPRAPKVYGTY